MKSNRCPRIKWLPTGSYLLLWLALQWIPGQALANIDPDSLEQQRDRYQKTLYDIQRGRKTTSDSLSSYPLHSYLIKAGLQRKLQTLPYEEVDRYLEQYQQSVAGRQLLASWLYVLAQQQQWQQFLNYYDPTLISSKLRCWQLEALHRAGYPQLALNKSEVLWLVGKSQPKICDRPFKRWQQAGRVTDHLLWQRLNLALDEKNYLLARFLSRQGSADLQHYSQKLLNINRHPKRLAEQRIFSTEQAYDRDIIVRGMKKLASRDSAMAAQLWLSYRKHFSFSPAQRNEIRQAIARQIIAANDPRALPWLIANDPNAEDSYLLEWRIRLALKQQQWQSAQRWIKQLPPAIGQTPRWRYWLARAGEQSSGTEQEAINLYRKLATERHYYGFLAADILGDRYGLNHLPINMPAITLSITERAAIQRAYEFYQLGELTPARREWYAAINTMSNDELIAASNLAHQWGWHQQAIHTTIKAGHWNDLDIRFPMAYQPNMLNSAKSATISPEWLYAIARQESAFASDARSKVGARGILQLMPSTARKVARSMGVPYRSKDLYQAKTNIALGSEYLRQLLEDFDGNHILATAAYNAGPQRVKKWLDKQQGSIEYDIWIETLPYHETRNYVQNVMAFRVIYGHQMGLETSLISKDELFIGRGNDYLAMPLP